MGNEASLEGGEGGGLAGLPEGVAGDGKGGFIQIPARMEADLKQLSEEERKQIAAVMSRAQGLQPGTVKDPPIQRRLGEDASHLPRQQGKRPDHAPAGISKSQTVDVFNQEKIKPGRSPSSISLLESQSKPEVKTETKAAMMPSFLSEGNPLSAMSSVVNKFSLFGDSDESSDKQKGQQQQPAKASAQPSGLAKTGLGSPKIGQQQQAPSKASTQQKTDTTQNKQHGSPKTGAQHQGSTKSGAEQQGRSKPGPQQQGTALQLGPGKPGVQQETPVTESQKHGPVKPGSQQQGSAPSGLQQHELSGRQDPPLSEHPQKGAAKDGTKQHNLPNLGPSTAGRSKEGQQSQTSIPFGPQQQEFVKSGPKQGSKSLNQKHLDSNPPPKKTLCPICTTTELLFHSPEKANYNTCTQCKKVVCSLCGFNPNPHITEVKEWLCLNCQMQRALGMDESAPSMAKQQPHPQKISDSPQRGKQALPISQLQKTEPTKSPDPIKPLNVSKQPVTEPPPSKPKDTLPNSSVQQVSEQKAQVPKTDQHKSAKQDAEVKMPSDFTGPEIKQTLAGSHDSISAQQKESQETAKQIMQASPVVRKTDTQIASPQKTTQQTTERSMETNGQKPVSTIKQPPSQVKDALSKLDSNVNQPAPQSAKSEQPVQKVSTAPPASKQVQPDKVQSTQQPPKQEQTRRFSLNIGGITETPKSQPTTPQESVTGKLFGFGSSFFSQASNLISTAVQPADHPAPASKPPVIPPGTQPAPKEISSAQSSPKPSPKPSPAKRETKPPVAQKPTSTPEKKIPTEHDVKPPVEIPKVAVKGTEVIKASSQKSNCPLCKTELNVGCKDPPNYNTCTECNNIVCNLCGFNPMPHLSEKKEWLCLNCQTQRALSGQLGGDIEKMPPALTHKTDPAPKTLPSSPKSMKIIPEAAVIKPDQEQQKQGHVSQKDEKSRENTREKPKELIREASLQKMQTETPSKPLQAEIKLEEKGKLSRIESLVSQPLKGGPFHQVDDKVLPRVHKEIEKIASPSQVIKKAEVDSYVIDSKSTTFTPVKKDTVETPLEKPPQKPIQMETVKEKSEKEDDKSEILGSSQQKSPQGLSDTGYSSDGISSSLGEIPNIAASDEKELLKEPSKEETQSQESSPSSPSDLAKLESTVLSILEAQTTTVEKKGEFRDSYDGYREEDGKRTRTRILPVTPESYSSDEEDLEYIQEKDKGAVETTMLPKKERRKLTESKDSSRQHQYDSIEDSSESEHSPLPQRKRKVSVGSSSSDEFKQEDSQGSGDEEDFIRKQIIEMSADEDASDEEEYFQTQIKVVSGEQKKSQEERKSKVKSASGKSKRLSKKSSTSQDDEAGRRHSWHDHDEEEYDESPESKFRETKSQEGEELSVSSVGGLRRFKTIELNSTTSATYKETSEQPGTKLYYEEPEIEMESLTDSPEDRSRGEGSSSLHASSFTPGTSPTSVSSLDEDSDSSPSHKKISEESKQQRKARHRAHGQVLPTIEDSSEEEELREEEELLKEQEKQREIEQQQRKSSSKKSKKDKDELRAQRRREHPKTPPSNLSPIEDASPTEELRQAAEMEELHRSSCSEYSPSIESEPEGFEINPEKILAVQKVYELPKLVSLYSPTEDNQEPASPKSLKSADEVYEEIMQKAKLLQNQPETDESNEKEPLYGGMLIEDYIYESLVEDTYQETTMTTDNGFLLSHQDVNKEFVQQPERKLRSPDEVYEDLMRKANYIAKDDYYYPDTPKTVLLEENVDLIPYATDLKHTPISSADVEILIKDEKTLLDADAAYEELMKRQRTVLTPGTSPTQSVPSSCEPQQKAVSTVIHIKEAENTSVTLFSAKEEDIETQPSVQLSSPMYPIPDVTITQHFTAEEDIEDQYISEYLSESQEISDAEFSDKTDDITEDFVKQPSTTMESSTTSWTTMESSSVVFDTIQSEVEHTPVPIREIKQPPAPTSSFQNATDVIPITVPTVVVTTSSHTDSVIVDIPMKSEVNNILELVAAKTIVTTSDSIATVTPVSTVPCESAVVSNIKILSCTTPSTVSSSNGHIAIFVPGSDYAAPITPVPVKKQDIYKSQKDEKLKDLHDNKKTSTEPYSTNVASSQYIYESSSKASVTSSSSVIPPTAVELLSGLC
ncbi:protein piccolo-like [Polypterus senegalus]|uniref:protein piccolo-like n=1 Tax=Polypterus senegalus TaxID=55291 RepID=UPI0019664431|nr:protein piccolo-like [Polypterus senegalus]